MSLPELPESLWISIVVSLITTVIIGTLLDRFVRPYIEVRKNRIVTTESSIIDLITLVKIVSGNLKVVYKEASSEKKTLLNPTEVNILSTRLAKIENDTRSIVHMLTILQVYKRQSGAKHDYVEQLARITGGSMRIEANIKANTESSINGRSGLRGVNKKSLSSYISVLSDLLDEIEALRDSDRNKSILKRIFL